MKPLVLTLRERPEQRLDLALLIVRGNAGERAGDRLRRGTIVIEGSAGDYPGSRMIAGTLIVLGECGSLPGYLMRRGTIVLANPPELAPTFVDCGAHQLAFASVFAGLLRPESRAAARLLSRPLIRFAGDMAALGKGEIFSSSRSERREDCQIASFLVKTIPHMVDGTPAAISPIDRLPPCSIAATGFSRFWARDPLSWAY